MRRTTTLDGDEIGLLSLFRHSGMGMLIAAPNGNITSANPEACRLLGRTEKETSTFALDDILDSADPEYALAKSALRTEGGFTGNPRLRRSDGSPFMMVVSLTDLRDRGRIGIVFLDFERISNGDGLEPEAVRSRTSRWELEASEQRFRITFEAAAIGMAHVSPDGHWIRVNPKLCEITGYRRGELLASTFQDITHADDLGEDLEKADWVLKDQSRVADYGGWRREK